MVSFKGHPLSGEEMYQLACRLFPICRSITGDGVRETLGIIKEFLPNLCIHEIPSGTQVFDWTVPDEWNISDAFIEDKDGNKIISFKENNLHVMGYSLPVDEWVDLDELLNHVYVQEDQPDAIPYVTSYYSPRFGFCMSAKMRDGLPDGQYRMYIDSSLKKGSLTYADLIIPSTIGNSEEILFSTYVCHPSMANNELSGPCVAVALAQYVFGLGSRRYSYRFVFGPETIGAITYLSQHVDGLKKNVIAAFNLSCVGDNKAFSYIESRYANTLADRLARNELRYYAPDYKRYSFLERGSDERQYNAPGIDIPMCAICRSKYGAFPEYHTSKDDLSFISVDGLQGSFNVHKNIIDALEHNYYYKAVYLCEPQLGKRGLYPTVSKKGTYDHVKTMMDVLAYADGGNDLIALSEIIGVPTCEIIPILAKLENTGLLCKSDKSF